MTDLMRQTKAPLVVWGTALAVGALPVRLGLCDLSILTQPQVIPVSGCCL